QAVWNALAHRELIPEASIGRDIVREEKKECLKRSAVPEPFETQRLREERRYVSSREAAPLTKEEEACFLGTLEEAREKEAVSDSIQRKADKKENAGIREALQKAVPEREKPQNTGQMELFDDCLLSKAARSSHRLIGQLFDTYWLVQYEEKLYIIDQHAAHEKIYYERFVKAFQERQIVSQYLSPPVIVTLSLQEQELLKNNAQYFQKFGFEIEPFGGREYAISAVPTELLGHTSEELFLEMLDNLSAKGENDGLDIFTGRLATMACKAAVKGNNRLSLQEANALIDELLTLENPYNCPHGRPTIISMTKAELEKKFKRII
ncbi:MAG: DNA mismatch repair protein MutL, partial [Eubacteriales bacterium]|nr:DNA mismatch repair protein MutL [Eubacteriales bacterium]